MLNTLLSQLFGQGRPPESDSSEDLPLRQILDKMPAGVYTCDPEGLITYYNAQAAEIWGRSPELRDPKDRYCGSLRLFSAQDGTPVAHDQCWMALALKTGQEFTRQEIVLERPDGTLATVLAHASPLYSPSGELLGAVNVVINVDDRKKGEDAETLLASIVSSSEDAIISKTLQGRILSWNDAAERLFGYSAEEAIGSQITLIIPPDKIDEERSIIERLGRGERIAHYETERVTKDGHRIPISLTISPVRDRHGRVIAASKLARDITARKQAEEERTRLHGQLRTADRRKDEFLAMLAHELRNPLASLCGSLQILRLSDDLNPTVKRLHDIMEQQVHHLDRLVQDLLEASRITRGRIELRKKPVDLLRVVATAVETSRPMIDAVGHQLAINVSTQPMRLDGDPVRLSQVVADLLNNAAKYTKPPGQIWLSVRREGDEAVISVRDNGLGIPADMLPRVFDMFAQVDRTLDRMQDGLGIGLALAKNLIELHGGQIEAHSEGLGKGSEFIVRLPLALNMPPVADPSLRRPRAALPRHRILVVDDARPAAYVLGKLLEKLGQEVHTVYDAAEAVECARNEQPDIVISDIAMPNMDGYELARQLRQQPGLNGIKLVALTGYGQLRDKQRAKAAGFDVHLVKPVSLDTLHDLLAANPSAHDEPHDLPHAEL